MSKLTKDEKVNIAMGLKAERLFELYNRYNHWTNIENGYTEDVYETYLVLSAEVQRRLMREELGREVEEA